MGKPKEQDVYYVLRRPDGSKRAELFMPPSTAEKINASRKAKGLFDGEWKPEEPDDLTAMWGINPQRIPEWMFSLMRKA